MRVIGGTARGTTLEPVPGDLTRPILDRVKTPLFDILRPTISSPTSVVDLFGGTGALGIEALSLGAKSCVFLDLNQSAVKTIRHNLEKTHLTGKAEVRTSDAFTYLRNTSKSFDLFFIDPPQFKNLWQEAMTCLSERPYLVQEAGIIVVKIHPDEEDDSFQSSSFSITDKRTYGKSTLLFWQR